MKTLGFVWHHDPDGVVYEMKSDTTFPISKVRKESGGCTNTEIEDMYFLQLLVKCIYTDPTLPLLHECF